MTAISKEKYINLDLPKIGKQKIIFDLLLLDQHEALTGKKIYDVWKELGEKNKSLVQIIRDTAIIVYAGVTANFLRLEKDLDELPNFHQFLSDFGDLIIENQQLPSDILDAYALNVAKITGTGKVDETETEKKNTE